MYYYNSLHIFDFQLTYMGFNMIGVRHHNEPYETEQMEERGGSKSALFDSDDRLCWGDVSKEDLTASMFLLNQAAVQNIII